MVPSTVIVFGGYGTFGQHVSRELATRGIQVTIAGRNQARAESAAATLPPLACGAVHRGIAADVSDPKCRQGMTGQQIAVNAAGPFSNFDKTLLQACLDVGCHYVDLADDRQYVSLVRAQSAAFAAAGLTAAYGCSSLPGISGALAAVLSESASTKCDHARVTLFIGNRNPKGLGAVQSAVATIGQPISAPQGTLIGFGDPERVPLYPPFGTRRTLNFNSPDYDLLPALLDINSVSVKVGFELSAVTESFGFFSRHATAWGKTLIPRLIPFSRCLGWVGSSGGQVMLELFAADQPISRGAVVARTEGQRLAALPAVHVCLALCRDHPPPPGAMTAYEAVGGRRLIELLEADGFDLRVD